jgi:hypothetical protein
MKTYGTVTECRGTWTFAAAPALAGSSAKSQPSSDDVQLMTGTEDRQRVVAVKPAAVAQSSRSCTSTREVSARVYARDTRRISSTSRCGPCFETGVPLAADYISNPTPFSHT